MEKKVFLLIILLVTVSPIIAYSQSYAEDTVWTRKTDQSAGMFQVKFSDNDSIIWAMGLENSLFFDAMTGEEIYRIPRNNEVLFFDEDRKFIQTTEARTTIHIFDTKTFSIIDTLENDGTILTGSYDISVDEKYYIATIPKGFRLWDLETKQIIKTRIFSDEPNMVDLSTDVAMFSCEENVFIGHVVKTYEDPNYPNDPKHFIIKGGYDYFDLFSMDSIDTFMNGRGFVKSKNCIYAAFATADPDFGVEVYDFNTKELLWKIPINGPSLTGIEFSPGDKYLVTSNGQGANCMIIWDIETGEEAYKYPGGSYRNIGISTNGKFITSSTGRYLFKWHAKWTGTTIEEIESVKSILYPNPTNGILNLELENPVNETTVIVLSDLNAIPIRDLYNEFLHSGQQSLSFDLSDLSDGVYFIQISNSELSLTYKLIKTK